ncbi:MAG TPA: hypothetical protein VGR35_09365 [Tepidisphaeraceae bacterium]|nr:hypothetical protein [Tepidisphaeraceae bacterium]
MRRTIYVFGCAALLALVLIVAPLLGDDRAAPASRAATAPLVRLYDEDPNHLWNRLHATIFKRMGFDGRTYGAHALDPLLWPSTRHLIDNPSNARLITLLDEFNGGGERLVRDPVKRATLQRDLWAVFDWAVARRYPELTDDRAMRAAELSTRLAKAIQALAMERARIGGLPDNYADAVASGEIPAAFDPAHPDRPFLPPDLFDHAGPWVIIGEADGAARLHQQFFTRSVFHVALNLPGGREATLAYLKQLGSVPKLWVDNPDYRPDASPASRRDPLRYTPDLPQFPPGTHVALIRQSLLIDDQGRLVPSRLIESVQLRVYRRIVPSNPSEATEDAPQAVFEWTLDRAALLAGRRGGLVPTKSDSIDFTLFMSHDLDPFEVRPHPGRRFTPPPSSLTSCMHCHNGPGVYSFQTFVQFQSPHVRPRSLYDTGASSALSRAVDHKHERYDWGLLCGLMRE